MDILYYDWFQDLEEQNKLMMNELKESREEINKAWFELNKYKY